MNIILKEGSNMPIYEQIVRQLKQGLIEEKVIPGELLPSIRSLARDLGISVITTKRAYEVLEKEGIIYAEAGKGFYVSQPDRQMLLEQQIREYEKRLGELVGEGRKMGLTLIQQQEILRLFYESGDFND